MLVNFLKVVNSTGGGEKVLCRMANEMTRRGHTVSVVCYDENGMPFFPLDKEVLFVNLREKEYRPPVFVSAKREILRLMGRLNRDNNPCENWMNKKRAEVLKTYLKQDPPDIIISYDARSMVILNTILNVEIPVIGMIHTSLTLIEKTIGKKEIQAYNKAALIQVLMQNDLLIAEKLFDAPIIQIGNEIIQREDQADLARDKEIYKICFIGRLDRISKRPHLLVQAFGKLKKKFPNWQLEIWGGNENYCEAELEKLIKECGEKEIRLCGVTEDVFSVLKDSDIFVIPSLFEGFGLALGEAMSMGVPGIGYKNCPAVNELIQDGKTGFLCVDGVDGLAEKMAVLMSDQELRIKMGKAAKAAVQEYAPEKIWKKWENIVEKTGEKN